MGTIVVGIDGSEGAILALDWAIGEARVRHDEVRLVHAWHVPTSVSMANAALPGASWTVLEDAARTILHDAGDHARQAGFEVGEVLVQHRPAAALVDQSRDADLLVVGTRGRGGFAGLLLGSVSQEVAHHAMCPVVIVPPTLC